MEQKLGVWLLVLAAHNCRTWPNISLYGMLKYTNQTTTLWTNIFWRFGQIYLVIVWGARTETWRLTVHCSPLPCLPKHFFVWNVEIHKSNNSRLDKYMLQCGQIYVANWTNISCSFLQSWKRNFTYKCLLLTGHSLPLHHIYMVRSKCFFFWEGEEEEEPIGRLQ